MTPRQEAITDLMPCILTSTSTCIDRSEHERREEQRRASAADRAAIQRQVARLRTAFGPPRPPRRRLLLAGLLGGLLGYAIVISLVRHRVPPAPDRPPLDERAAEKR